MGRRLEKSTDEFDRKRDRGRRKKENPPDGGMLMEELQEAIARQDKKNIIDLNSRRPVVADNVHTGQVIHESTSGTTSVYRTGSTIETAARKPLPEESDEEKLARLEKKISSELTDLEQKFAKSCINDYPEELKKAINKIESRGSTIAEIQISAIRTSYINNVKRWGLGRQLAPEKAELLGKYLELNLPVGIPEEKVNLKEKINLNKNIPMERIPVEDPDKNTASTAQIKSEQEIKREFTPDQLKELDDFFSVIDEEYLERWPERNFNESMFLGEVQEAFKQVFRQAYVSEGIFSAMDEDAAAKIILEKTKNRIKI